MKSRVATGYAVVLAAVWLGYGGYSLFKGTGQALMIFLFSVACASVLCTMFFFSAWMMRQYERSDRSLQEALCQTAHHPDQKAHRPEKKKWVAAPRG
jgi:hypothetical protein